jgi:hypothetical protein
MIIKCEETLEIVVSLEEICIKSSTAIWMLSNHIKCSSQIQITGRNNPPERRGNCLGCA